MTRPEWEAHPHYPTQTLLLRSHERFRAISRELVDSAVALPRSDPRAFESISWAFESWMSAMRSHEHYEESKLYPYLAWRYGTSMECLERQHAALHRARDEVRDALRDAKTRPHPSHDVARALTQHRRVLLAHLAEEEAAIIPMLLELAPDEFANYYERPIGELLPRQ